MADQPWLMRTYSGHSSARASNELYRSNLSRGQTGLSVAFDLPTQTGYDPDHPLARGEVGKVGVSIADVGDMHALFDGIPLDEMNTSMTINATAAWLLGLYVTVAEENGIDRAKLVRRQRGRPVHRGAREAAGDVGDLGTGRPRSLRRHRSEAPAAALRRAGQLALSHGVAAREQRAEDRPRGARGDARPQRPR